jgi:spermidine synthase
VIHVLFFLSGLSALIYQVAWVRLFGRVFGNTIYSASLVVAVFMLGLGVGGLVAGRWADRRYAVAPGSLLRAYAWFELAIAVMGLIIAALLPRLDEVSALASSYVRDESGWNVLSVGSYLARAGMAVALLTPITLLMGGTLTLLIRHLVRRNLDAAGWQIATLYAVNTAGAAAACLVTDFALVPNIGLLGAQLVAVACNVCAGAGAWYLSTRDSGFEVLDSKRRTRSSKSAARKTAASAEPGVAVLESRVPSLDVARDALSDSRPSTLLGTTLSLSKGRRADPRVALTAIALALSGFAAMGMEIVWFRHFSILLGGFRAVFALLLAVILIGIGAGAFLGGVLDRRIRRPGVCLMITQALFVAFALIGLAAADATTIDARLATEAGPMPRLTEIWFNAKPILLEVAIPALLMGFSFPLANAMVQHAERSVGLRAGVLYLSNTLGAVCGSVGSGFVLLPMFGVQRSTTILMLAAALAIVPLALVTRPSKALAGSMLIAPSALAVWLLLPATHVMDRALPRLAAGERQILVSEGLLEVIAVTEIPGEGRRLFTNGHEMSSTRRLAQRYMRALAHIPLLSMDRPESVLVIGFGVGNTTHAATLHPSVVRVDVADLSKAILEHAGYFSDVHRDVLRDARVTVYVNDGRHHLHMQPAATYDLITLEPPPIAYAGVAALYSREFYALARTRLKPKGYLSQWLPAYQVPAATTVAMIRSFIDVFPQAVLLSGAGGDLLLLGANDTRIEIDPARVDAALARAPQVRADLHRLDLGTAPEIVGTFIGSAGMLAEATRDAPPVTDDRPIQEYGVVSLLHAGDAVPASLVDVSRITDWCPRCFLDGKPLVEGLDTYLELLNLAYTAAPHDVANARSLATRAGRTIAGSAYLGAIVPESAELHNLLGLTYASNGDLEKAIVEFREALRLAPDSAATHWHLGAALASRGAHEEAVRHLRRSVELDPGNEDAQRDLRILTTR